MTYSVLGAGALDYLPCRYGASKLTFRGPKRSLTDPYVVFLGGLQTYGKYIEQPFPLRVEHQTGVASVNLGQPNAGLDVFARDATVAEIARKARVSVLEVLGAANMSNRFYSVHPRRNDRFLGASPKLKQLFPEVDFAQFNFTRHMLEHLYGLDQDRFVVIRTTLQKVWVQRLHRLRKSLGGELVLLWMGQDAVPDQWKGGVGQGPTFITRMMMDELRSSVSAIVEAPASAAARALGTSGMVFDELEESAARLLPGPQVHDDVAHALRPVLDGLM